MNEPTLYQRNTDHNHHGGWTDDRCKHPGCEAVDIWVVPVEPDYEAMAKDLWRKVHGTQQNGVEITEKMVGHWAHDLMRAGIGDTEDDK